jgi:hypothetical protein
MYYQNLSIFEKKMAQFADKIGVIVGLELNNKITPEDAYQQIREMYKELKRLRKEEKPTWEKTE